MVAEKYLAKRKKLYAAFMDLEMACDKVDWNALREILKIFGVQEKLLEATNSFYKDSNAYVKVEVLRYAWK